MDKDRHPSDSDLHAAAWFDRLQDFVDGDLAPAEAVAVQVHLASCPSCATQHQSLLAVHAQLREQFAEKPTLSSAFERLVLARIDEVEQQRLALAKEREQQEYEARRSQATGRWRQLAHAQLGNVIGVAATLGAVMLALQSFWPKSVEPAIQQRVTHLGNELAPSFLHNYGLSGPVLSVVLASAVAAAIAMWFVKKQEQRSR